MIGRFRFTPVCCCGQKVDCLEPCVPDCGVVYDGFVFDDETVNPYKEMPSFVRADNREDYYKCGGENWFRHYVISRVDSGSSPPNDSIVPSLENSPLSGWCYRQTYTAKSGGAAPSSSEDWFLKNQPQIIGGLTESNIYATSYDSYPHATSLVWYKIMFLPIDTNIIYDCFSVSSNTPEDYRDALPLSLGSRDPTDYCVSVRDCLCPAGTDANDCDDLFEYWTLISSCGERYDVSTETSSTVSWSTNGEIDASAFESWIRGTCAGKKQALDYTMSMLAGFRSWTVADFASHLPTSGWNGFSVRQPRGLVVVGSREGLYNYAYEYTYPIIMDGGVFVPAVHDVDSTATSDISLLNRYVTPADQTYPAAEAKLGFGSEANIPTHWALVTEDNIPWSSQGQVVFSRESMFKLDRSGDLDERFAGEYYIYAAGQSCGTAQMHVQAIEDVYFPLGVFFLGDSPDNPLLVYSHGGIPHKERPLEDFISVNDFVTFDETNLRWDKLFIKSYGGGSMASDDALVMSNVAWRTDVTQDGVTRDRIIKRYAWVATFPLLSILASSQGSLKKAFQFGWLFGKRTLNATYPLTAFLISGSASGYGPHYPYIGDNSNFSSGDYAGRILDDDYSHDVGTGTGLVPAQSVNVSDYDKFIETFSAYGSDAYRSITHNGHNYIIPKIPSWIETRMKSAIPNAYVSAGAGGDDIQDRVLYPMVRLSAIIVYEEPF